MSYDPTIGRFVSEDPIAFEGGDVNLYRYVQNGPTDATDPSGLQDSGGGSIRIPVGATPAMIEESLKASQSYKTAAEKYDRDIDNYNKYHDIKIKYELKGSAVPGIEIEKAKVEFEITIPAGYHGPSLRQLKVYKRDLDRKAEVMREKLMALFPMTLPPDIRYDWPRA